MPRVIEGTNNDLPKLLRACASGDHARLTRQDIIFNAAADEIELLRIGQAVIAKHVGFYKPETPSFELVSVPLAILRRALHCVPPPYPEDALNLEDE